MEKKKKDYNKEILIFKKKEEEEEEEKKKLPIPLLCLLTQNLKEDLKLIVKLLKI